MIRIQELLIKTAVLLFVGVFGGNATALAQPGHQRDPLGFLKHALTEANAPALSTDQETQLTTLITNFRNANKPTGPDETLKAAHAAYAAAILAGDTAAAQAQAGIIASKMAELSGARLQAQAKFDTDVIAILKAGGQLDPLKQKFGDEHVVGLVSSLAGGPGFGGPGFGPPGGPGFGPGKRPEGFGPRPGKN